MAYNDKTLFKTVRMILFYLKVTLAILGSPFISLSNIFAMHMYICLATA